MSDMNLLNNNWLPEGWEEVELWDVVTDVAMWPFWSNLKVSMFTDYWVPVIKWWNLSWMYVNWKFSFVSEEKANSLWRSIWYPNDFVLTHRWTLGQISLIPKWKFDRYVVSQSQLRFSTKEEVVDELFLLYFFKTRQGQYELLKSSSQVWVPAISTPTKSVREVELKLPPLPEQQAITSILSSFDDKIDLLREQNETLEKIAQIFFKEWFGKYNVDRPEELPEGWRVGKITDIIKRKSISYKCVKTDIDNTWTTPIIDQWADWLYGYTRRDPDFIASVDEPVVVFTNHTCNFRFVDYPFCAIQNVIPYHWINWYDENYIYFHTKWMISFTEYKWHRPSFVAIDTIIPDAETAKKYSNIAKEILRKISDNNIQIQSLSKTRDALLPKLMSGKVRVKF